MESSHTSPSPLCSCLLPMVAGVRERKIEIQTRERDNELKKVEENAEWEKGKRKEEGGAERTREKEIST